MEGRPLDESELLARATAGNQRAYEELVHIYSEIAFRTAFAVLGSAADAEEAAQDAFVKAFHALPRFRRGEPFRPWLLAIVGNEARSRRRAAGRRVRLELRAAEAARTGDAAPSPEAVALAASERQELLRAVESLEPLDRDVIVLRFLLELSVAETAATLGVVEGTVKSRLSRALGRLRTQVREPASA
ncbi:MAG TPA: RNA polymerase sigma factor [Candidatus Dormibacteraeota bacterium]